MTAQLKPQRTEEFCYQVSQYAYDTYAELGYDVIMATVHGSYLYGTAHSLSDVDFYVVVQEGKSKQKVYQDHTDVIMVTFEDFLSLINAGSHQAVEALYSPYKIVNFNSPYAAMLGALRPNKSAFVRKSLSAANSFRGRAESEESKQKREKFLRHAARLEKSATDMCDGKYHPVYCDFSEQEKLPWQDSNLHITH